MRADVAVSLQRVELRLLHAQRLELGEDVVAGLFAVDHQQQRAVLLVEAVRARADFFVALVGLLVDGGGHVVSLPRPGASAVRALLALQ
ncbi:hypothetical protein Q3O94_17425 [Ralstonia pseudosolanacearum]|nr:hypothetical protein [Ralstonia pseudosolanacearum]